MAHLVSLQLIIISGSSLNDLTGDEAVLMCCTCSSLATNPFVVMWHFILLLWTQRDCVCPRFAPAVRIYGHFACSSLRWFRVLLHGLLHPLVCQNALQGRLLALFACVSRNRRMGSGGRVQTPVGQDTIHPIRRCWRGFQPTVSD